MPEKYIGNKTHFNKPPTMWDGQEVFNTSNLYGNLNVIKNDEEPSTPNINTDGNVNVKKDVNVDGTIITLVNPYFPNDKAIIMSGEKFKKVIGSSIDSITEKEEIKKRAVGI